MEKAADLLQYSEWTISMTAQHLGYKDPYNVTHRFRKYFGCSPSQYRKNITETLELPEYKKRPSCSADFYSPTISCFCPLTLASNNLRLNYRKPP